MLLTTLLACGGLFHADSKTDEVATDLNGIRVAEIAYDAEFDRFVSAGTFPRPLHALDRRLVPWEFSASGGFLEVGWAPDGSVRGSYAVVLSADERDFVVHGWQDLDQDGELAHYTATKSLSAVRVSPKKVR